MKYYIQILLSIISILSFLLVFNSCQKEIYVEEKLEGWTETTHSNLADPDYSVVFNQTLVNRIDIVLSSEEYETMQDDLQDILGNSGGGGGPGGVQSFSDETPVYVPADFYFNGTQWYDVGVRYKGNSSLSSSYSSGIGKLPLRLDFDHFDESNPTITGQRFYGFKQLSLSSNYNDKAFVREKTASDIFREFGVPAARSSFYEVYIDYGPGPEYFGLYTMMEVIFDTMLQDYFGSNTGNCYKPDGEGAKFNYQDFDLDDFGKKTNEREGNWCDIKEMHDVLHDDLRTSDLQAWQNKFESIFDVDGFLRYLAANNTIQNWDTYGNMTHNYYLYHDPADGLLKWITWDNNEAFQNGNRMGALSFKMNEVTDDWPLISYIIQIPEYRAIYDGYIREFIDIAFNPSKMDAQYSNYNALISESATSEIGNNTFLSNINEYSDAISTLRAHCYSRYDAAEDYLE